MSRGDRGATFKVVTVLFIAVLISLIFVQIFDSGRLLGEAGERQEANSRSYAADANEQIAKCPVSNIPRYTKCVVEVIESTNEQQRSERDLVAQMKMGEWAFWMVIISAIVAAVTAVGVWWVKRTLDATLIAATAAHDAVTVTRDIGEKQIGAYLVCEKIDYECFGQAVRATFRLRNVGQTVAFDVEIYADFSVGVVGGGDGNPIARPDPATGYGRAIEAGRRGTVAILFVAKNADGSFSIRGADEPFTIGEFAGVLRWKDVFGTEITRTFNTEAPSALGAFGLENMEPSKTGTMRAHHESGMYRTRDGKPV